MPRLTGYHHLKILFFLFLLFLFSSTLLWSQSWSANLFYKIVNEYELSGKSAKNLDHIINDKTLKTHQLVYLTPNIQRNTELLLFIDKENEIVFDSEKTEQVIKVINDTIIVLGNKHLLWNGHVESSNIIGTVNLSLDWDGNAMGTIILNGTNYYLSPIENGLHVLYTHDKQKLAEKWAKEVKNKKSDVLKQNNIKNPSELTNNGIFNLQKTTATCTYQLDLAVFYATNVGQSYSTAYINSAISGATNQIINAYKNSKINNVTVNLVYSGLLSFNLTGDEFRDFSYFKNNSTANSILNNKSADIAIMLIDYHQGDFSGIKGVASGFLADEDSRHVFLQITSANTYEYIFSHETNHLLGAQHAPDDGWIDDSAPTWARGYKFRILEGWCTPYNAATIMAYPVDLNFYYNPILYFSNPSVKYFVPCADGMGAPTGDSYHNNAQRIINTMPAVSDLGGNKLGVEINGGVNAYTGQGALTSSVCGGNGNYSYQWWWSNGSIGPYKIGTNSILNYSFVPGDNLLTLKVTSGDGFYGERSRYFYVMSSYPKLSQPEDFEDNENMFSTALHNVYPNPFNPVTHINISIAEPTYVELEVFDVTGERVSTLHRGELNSGLYNFDFNGDKLSGGIYFVRLITAERTFTRRILLLK